MNRSNIAHWVAGAAFIMCFETVAANAAPPAAKSVPRGSAPIRATAPAGTWAKSAGLHREALFTQWGMNTRFVAGYGLCVTSVAEGTAADRLGLKPGDVVMAWNGQSLAPVGLETVALIGPNGAGPVTFKIREARSGELVYRTLP